MKTPAAAALLLLAGCVAGHRGPETPPASLKEDAVRFEVLERAHDGGPFHLVRNGDNVVDANSVLVVTFAPRKDPAPPPPSADWSAVNELLGQTRDLARERARVEELPFADDASRKARLDAVQAFAVRFTLWVSGLYDLLAAAGLTRDAADAVVRQGYPGVERWLAERLDRLKAEAAALTRGKERFRVTVQAFHDPVGGDRKALHVANYDQLPAGKLQPIDRYGLKLTPRETERLNMALQQADAAATLIREYREAGRSIREGLLRILREADEALADWAKRLSARPEAWAASFDVLLSPVKTLAEGPDPAKSEAAKKVLESLAPVRALIVELGGRVAAADEARRRIRDLIASPKLAAAAVPGVLQAASDLAETLKTLPPRLEAAARAARETRAALGRLGVEVAKAVPEDVVAFFDSLDGPAKELAGLLAFAASYVGRGATPLAAGGDALADHENVLIPRPLDSLPDGEVELERGGMAVGDRLTLVVRIQDQDDAADGEQATYRASVKLTGAQRAVTGQLIFARAARGDDEAERWKPNVAALATWHYRFRDPSFLGELWNGVNPGLGIHLASLDQAEDNVEFGAGVSASFFDGLVTAGYGWNFSRSRDGEYYFVGIGLLETLDKLRSVTTKP